MQSGPIDDAYSIAGYGADARSCRGYQWEVA